MLRFPTQSAVRAHLWRAGVVPRDPRDSLLLSLDPPARALFNLLHFVINFLTNKMSINLRLLLTLYFLSSNISLIKPGNADIFKGSPRNLLSK